MFDHSNAQVTWDMGAQELKTSEYLGHSGVGFLGTPDCQVLWIGHSRLLGLSIISLKTTWMIET